MRELGRMFRVDCVPEGRKLVLLLFLGLAQLLLPQRTWADPNITAQPQKRTVVEGSSYSFYVTADGTAPLHYQWRRNDGDLAGKTNSTLNLTNIQAIDAGDYQVVITNSVGAVTSVVATLTVRSSNDPVYATPQGGWAYIYEGSLAANPGAAALDGTWDHDTTTDSWAGDGRGVGNGPEGGLATANGVLTIEDAIPTAGVDNRSFYLTHSLSQETAVTNANTILNDGVTLSFRARLTPAPPSDPLTELTNAPNGFVNAAAGKGMVGLRQSGGGGMIISFSLNQAVEDTSTSGTFNFGQAGLHMNSSNGPTRSALVDPGFGTLNLLPLDPTVFHEFWITIQDNGAAPGTHTVSVYVDGSQTPTVFNVTGGQGSEGTSRTNYLALGPGSSSQLGGYDIDFLAYKPGLITPFGFNDPAGIVMQPTNQLVAIGQMASFNVGVTGTPPYSFQWYKNNALISDATNSFYTTPPAVAGDDGAQFTVVVMNPCNAVTSSPPAILSLIQPPVITAQPQSLMVTNGDPASFSVTASSAVTLGYQWRFGGMNIFDATNSGFTIGSTQPSNAGSYDVVVSNISGSVTSVVAMLIIKELDYGDAPDPNYPTLLANNGARHVIVPGFHLGTGADSEVDGQPNASAMGDDVADGDDEDGVSFTSPLLVGELATVEVVASANGLLDAWIDFNGDGGWATGGDQIFTNQALLTGTNLLMFRVPATANPVATFARFRFSSAGELSFYGPAADGEVEDVAVTNTAVADLAVTMTDAPDPAAVGSNLTYTITVANLGPSAASGVALTNSLPASASFVSASSSQGSCSQEAGVVVCALGSLANGAMANVTITVTPTLAGMITNRAELSGNEIDLLPANNIFAEATRVENPPTILTPPQSLTVTNGDAATFTVTAGGAEPLSYQWRLNGGDLGGETNATLSISNAGPANEGGYAVRVSNEVGSLLSSEATLTVLVPPAITLPPLSRTNLAGSEAAFSVVATGTEPLNYQWHFDGTNVLTAETNSTLLLTNVQTTNAGIYHVVVNNSAGSVTSVVATLTVLEVDFGDAPDPVYATRLVSNGARHLIVPGIHLGAGVDFEPDGQPDSTATGDDVGGVDDEDGVVFTSPILAGQMAAMTVTVSTNGFLDAWVDFNGNGSWADAGEQVFSGQTLFAGSFPLGFAVPPDAVVGNTSARFRFSSTGGLSFDGLAADGEVEDYGVTVTRQADLAVAALDIPDPVAVGSNITYTIQLTNRGPSLATGVTLSDQLPGGVTFVSATPSQGSCSNDNGIVACALGNLASGGNGTVAIVVIPAAAGSLTNLATLSAAEVDPNPEDNSAETRTQVMDYPAITMHPPSQIVTNGNSVTFNVAATGTGPLSYQWYFNGTNQMIEATNAALILTNVQGSQAGQYSVQVGNAVGSVVSDAAILTVRLLPMITVQPQSQSVTNGDNVSLSVTATGTDPLSYQWRFNGADLGGETSATLVLNMVQPLQAGDYTVHISNEVGETLSEPATLTVLVPPAITMQPESRINFAGSDANFSVAATGTGPLSFQWYFNQTNALPGANQTTLSLTNVQASQSGIYQVVVGNSAGSVTSVVATLTVLEVDFGDAPDPTYPSLFASGGAYHLVVPGIFLGAGVDFETDGQPNSTATGDDAGSGNDEDGVSFTSPLLVARTATLEVVASTNGFLEAWIDFGRDGSWAEPEDRIFSFAALVPGTNLLGLQVPATAVLGDTFARFRFSSIGGLGYDGAASDGEVEDYQVTIMPAVDLAVTQLDSPDPVQLGGNLTYTLMITNGGASTATGVTLTDQLPGGTAFVSALASQGNCSNLGGSIQCMLDPLVGGGTATVTIVVTATRLGTLTNTVSVAANEFDFDPGNNLASQLTAVVVTSEPLANPGTINIDQRGPATLYPSTIFVSGLTASVYKVTVTLSNLSHSFPDDLDILLVGPQGQAALLMSDAGAGFAINSQTLIFDDDAATFLPDSGQISSGASRPTNFEAVGDSFPAPAPAGPYGSSLSAFAGTDGNGTWSLYVVDDEDQDTGFITDGWSLTVSTLNPIADLAVSTLAPPGPVALGSNLTYSVIVTNRGPAEATEVSLVDQLPDSVGIVAVTPSQGLCTNIAGAVYCALGSLAAGAEAVVTIVVVPNSTGTITNQTSVAGSELDLDPSNNVASAVATVQLVTDLSLAMSEAPDPVPQEQNLTYTLLVTNRGPNQAVGVSLTDPLPAGAVFVSAVTTQGTCTNTGGTVTCSLGNLDVASSVTVTIVANPTVVGTITNSAIVVAAGTLDSNFADNSATAVTLVEPTADLAVSITGSPDPVAIGLDLTYTLIVSNHGPGLATGATLLDELPKSAQFVSVTASQGACSNASGTITCELGDLDTGAIATITVVVTPTAVGSTTNSASVAGNRFDPNPGDNTAAAVISVLPASDLAVTVVDSPDPVVVTESLTYVLAITNGGPNTATGVMLTDTLPTTTSFVSATPSQGNCAHANGIVTCDLGVLGHGSNATVTVIVAPMNNGTITNSASVTASEADLNLDNNFAQQPTAVILSPETFLNNGPITIVEMGPASPYPSTILVSGLTTTVYRVTLTLSNLSHNFPDDLDILLVGPNGQTTLLMSDAGGGNGMSHVNLTFDDAAAFPLPDSGQIVSGTFSLTDHEPGSDFFPAPAPAGPFGTSLSVFNGIDPNGSWSLYIVDDATQDAGLIMEGWSIAITTINPISDLGLAMMASPDLVARGSNLTYTITVTNRGPGTASAVTVLDPLPIEASFVSVAVSQGACTNDNGVVRCELGGLAPGADAVVTMVVQTTSAGMLTNMAGVDGGEVDLTPENNAFAVTTIVQEPPLIVSPPASQTVTNGDLVTFSVAATGQDPLSYQWYFNQSNLLAMATNATLQLPNVQASDAGIYTVQVGNGVGVAMSDPAILTVRLRPMIVAPPQSLVVTNGDMAAFGVIATGTGPLSYQWSFNNNPLSGETNATLLISDAQMIHEGSYAVGVSNEIDGVLSAPVTLTVLVRPFIIEHPQSRTNFAGSDAAFAVATGGTGPLSYQWYFEETNALAEATNSLLLLTNVQTGQSGLYQVVVNNSVGSMTSVVATLTVLEVDFGDAPDPTYSTLLASSGAHHVIVPGFHLGAGVDPEPDGQPNGLATGDDARGLDDDDGVTILGPLLVGHTAMLSVTASTNGFLDAWIDFNADGAWVEGEERIFNSVPLAPGTNLVSFPVPATASAADTIARFRFSSAGALAFNGPAADGEVEDYAVTISPAADVAVIQVDAPDPVPIGSNLTYTITVTNAGASTATGVTLTDPLPANVSLVSVVPSQGSCSNQSGIIVCDLGSLPQGGNATVVLLILPAELGPITNTTSVAANEFDFDLTNNAATLDSLVFEEPPGVIVPPASQIATNGDNVTFLATVSGTGPLSYQWQYNNVELPGATNSTLTLNAVTVGEAGSYRVSVTNRVGVALSDPATLTVLVRPGISDIPDLVTNEDMATDSIAFTVQDLETPTANLVLAGYSSNPILVPEANIIFGGTDGDRTVTILPATNQFGTATITITVMDADGITASDSFVMTVLPVNDLPIISGVSTQIINEDGSSGPIDLVVGDVETPAESLMLTATSLSGVAELPPNVVLGGNGPNRTITVTPLSDQSGLALIEILVTDEEGGSAGTSFFVFVNPVNDSPTLDAIGDLMVAEDSGQHSVALTGISSGATNENQNLVVSAISSDPGIVPHPTISYSSPTASGTLHFTSVGNSNGTAMITVTVNDGDVLNSLVTRTFTVTVTPVNDPPALSAVEDQIINEDESSAVLALVVEDAESPGEALTLTAGSSNPDLAPTNGIVFGGSGAGRTVTVTPLPGQIGTAIVTLIVTDPDGASASNSFELIVLPVNDPPVISPIASQSVNEDVATPPIVFTIGDLDTPADNLTLAGHSSNPTLVPVANIVFGGSGTNRTVTVTPASNQSGTATITVRVNDGEFSATTAFLLSVSAVNDPPTISDVPNQTVSEDTALGVPLVVGDPETAPGSLNVSATSSNPALIPNANVILTGSGPNRTATIMPATNLSGTATITLSVNDGATTNSDSFVVTVNAVNDTPTLASISNLTISEDAGPQVVNLSGVGTGAANENQTLMVTANSSNTGLIPHPAINYTSPNATGTLTFTPVPNSSGSATVTVTVTDGQALNNTIIRTFTVTVTASNDGPAISAIANQSTPEDVPIAIPFIVSDPEIAGSGLVVSATSTNTTLVANTNILINGSGTNRTVTITPTANLSGTTRIALTVTDGSLQASNSFVLTVVAVNDPPTLDPLPPVGLVAGASDFVVNLSGITSGAANEVQTLSISAVSSNTAAVTIRGKSYSSPNTIGTQKIKPVAVGKSIVTVTVSDQQTTNSTFSRSFEANVRASANATPTISTIAGQTINEDSIVGPVAFTIGDSQTPATLLSVAAFSSNPVLVPNGNFVFGGSGSNRTLTFTPATNQSGTANVTISVTDTNFGLTNRTFLLTVNPVNDRPTISGLVDQAIGEDASTGFLAFTVGDAETSPANLVVTAGSSNPTLVPGGNIVLGGSGSLRTLVITPATNQFGTATITVTANDGVTNASASFVLTVNPSNDLPTISAIANQTINENSATAAIAFTVGDVETSVTSLTLSNSSTNPSLLPNGSISFGGSGANRTVTVTPAAHQSGTATITLSVSDANGGNASSSFELLVNPANDAPTLDALGNMALNANVGPQTINLTGIGSGALSENQTLAISAISSNPGLIPHPTVSYTSPNSTGSLSFIPMASSNGTATITVTVNDGQAQNNLFTRTFEVTVNGVPTITDVADMTTSEDFSTPDISFNVGDAETPAENLSVTRSSSNPSLVPDSSIVLGGAGTNRTLTITPATNQFGTATITLMVTDASGASAVDTFVLTVKPVTDPPVILTHPQGQTVTNGADVTFSVTASGEGLLTYQWYHNGSEVAGAIDATLTLTGVQGIDAGGYSASVRSGLESVVSDTAQLRVLVPPLITAITHADGSASVSFMTENGLSYVVEFKNTVTDTLWEFLSPVSGTGGILTVIDSSATAPSRIYRVRVE